MDAALFPKRLRELREAAGVSQAELGRSLGISQQAVGHWEAGNRVPPLDVLVRLAEVLGVTVNDFLEPARKRRG
jgi:transcriptional regulator with XRE-family HTH domain